MIMNQTQNIMLRLRRLVELERMVAKVPAGGADGKHLADEIESLRDGLPTSILTHHDSFKIRGKPSIAAVNRGICRACHLALPKARVIELRKIPDDLSICDNCGAFIYFSDEPPPQVDAALVRTLAARQKPNPSKGTRQRMPKAQKPPPGR
jgi:predicted  nucleic acid-binding Zn-ribbon protein